MKTVKSTLVAACVVLLSILSSCSNDDTPVLDPNSALKDIYFAGYKGTVATYWKNGVATSLTDGKNCFRKCYNRCKKRCICSRG